MRVDKCALVLCAVLALSFLEPITARKGFGFSGGSRHSYPRGGGLSGHGSGGSHSYPSSGGLSGHGSGGSHGYPSSGSHGYPSSGGLSGGGRGYPSSGGGSHGYPASGGLSGSGGTGGRPGSGYPSSGSHGYPASGGLSGNSKPGSTNIHHHYHYAPPQQISYSPVRGGPPMSYPVYHGTPPSYVYQYKDSGSKYGTLLAGLALLNLGTLAGTAYAIHRANDAHNSYKAQPGEVCKFGLKKSNGDYEETRIDCQLITSFIFQEQAKTQGPQNNMTITTTTVTNVTTINSNPADTATPVNQTDTKVLYEMLANGTLVPVNVPLNGTQNATSDATANNMTSSVVTTTTNTTTVTNALEVKGKPVDVTPDMECFVIRDTPTSKMRKGVPCGLLQTYAEKSIQRNSGFRNVPTFAILTVMLAAFVIN